LLALAPLARVGRLGDHPGADPPTRSLRSLAPGRLRAAAPDHFALSDGASVRPL